MRKALIAFILIFALMLAGGVYAMHDAALPRDEVVVSEILRRGDASAAEGLSLAMHTNFDNHLFWDVDYTLGQTENTKTEAMIGEELFRIVAMAQRSGVDPEEALSRANDRFIEKYRYAESRLGGFDGKTREEIFAVFSEAEKQG